MNLALVTLFIDQVHSQGIRGSMVEDVIHSFNLNIFYMPTGRWAEWWQVFATEHVQAITVPH